MIVGAGIAGLAAAAAFARRGAAVTVLERARALGDVGAGIQVTPNGMRIVDALGVGEALRARSIRAEAVEAMDALSGRCLNRMALDGPDDWRLVTREALVAVLADGAARAGARVVTGKRVSGVHHGAVEVVGRNRETRRADLVVGADGIRSTVRAAICGPTPATFTGQSAWRAVVAADQRPVARIWMAPGRHVVTYPVGPGRLNVVAVKEEATWIREGWSHPDDPATLRAAFPNVAPALAAILARVEETARWGLFRRAVAPRWHDDGLAVVGDAAHPTLPFLGQGANLALEDAWVLAREAMAGRIGRYEALRRPRAVRAIRAANANARAYHLGGVARLLAHTGLRLASAVAPGLLLGRLAWLYGHDAAAEDSSER